MKQIDSRQNASFKLLKELATQRRARRAHQAAWLEGERLCTTYLEKGLAAPVLVTAASAAASVPGSLGKRLQADVKGLVRDHWVLDDQLFSAVSQVESGVGWGLIIPAAPTGPRQPDEHTPLTADVVVLDRLQDPGNLGTLMRSAAAAGVEEVWCLEPTVDVWSPKVLRAAMGAHFVMHVVASLPEPEMFAAVKARGLRLLAADHGPGALSIYSPTLDLTQPCAWVFGQEGDGVAPSIRSEAQRVEIPQSDQVESLNVAAAAAICLFEMVRQRA
jgi:RNA methyltransferase, TrmH family